MLIFEALQPAWGDVVLDWRRGLVRLWFSRKPKRMGATTYELDSSHVPMLSQPERVIDVIRTAAKAIQTSAAAA